MNISLIIAIAIIVLIILYIYNWILNKRSVTELDQNEFHSGQAQVIDVREKVDYDYGHKEARNILSRCLNKRFQGLRKRSTYLSL